MVQRHIKQSSIYCRKCGYDLRGSSEKRCPECGLAFHPLAPSTFSRWPKGYHLRLWVHRLGLTLLSLVLLVVGATGWLYRGWRAEQPTISYLRQLVDDMSTVQIKVRSLAPNWLVRLVGQRCAWLFERVAEVDALSVSITDRDLAIIGQLRHLRVLEVSCSRDRPGITNAGLHALSESSRLRMVHISNGSIDDSGSDALCKLTELETLELPGTRVGDRTLANLRGLRSLKALWVGDTPVTDAGLACLAALPNLERLWLDETAVTDAGMACLAKMPNLCDIVIDRTKVSDVGIEHLSKLPHIRRLCANYTDITNIGLAHIGNMQDLTWLSLWGTKITDEGLQRLRGLKHLAHLQVELTPVTQEAQRELQRYLPALRLPWQDAIEVTSQESIVALEHADLAASQQSTVDGPESSSTQTASTNPKEPR